MEIDKAGIARQLCGLLPSRVQTRVLADKSFMQQYGQLSRMILTFGDSISIDQRELVAATRRALGDQGDQSVKDIYGRPVLVTSDHTTVILREMADEGPVQVITVPDLMVVSPQREHRMLALTRIIANLGPTASDYSWLQVIAGDRELSESEISDLFEEVSTGFEAHRAKIASAHNAGQIQIETIVPNSRSYYERFCGPSLRGDTPERYLTEALPAYRQELLRRNLVQGLEICLLGALRDDLLPANWTCDVSQDDMWNALEKIDRRGNPFLLLGVLDIAITRQQDERYRTLAANTMLTLLQGKLLRPDGIDGYEILPLFAELVWHRINALEGGALNEPFWKRMCAWMHAGLLAQSTTNIQIDLEALRGWVESNRDMAGVYAHMIDLRREPMYRAGEFSRSFLREEIIGRLIILRIRHQAAGRLVPHSEDLDAAITQLTEEGSPLSWAMPGPLDGHRRPADEKGRALSEADVAHIMEEIAKEPHGAIWSKLAYFSQFYDLGEKNLDRACEASAKIPLDVDLSNGGHKIGRLLDVCIIAAAHRNKELARSISATALARASHSPSGKASVAILQVLLVASAAFEREDEWHAWIEDQLASFASRLPHGEATQTLLEHLNEIKKVLPVTLSIYSRAEALACAAN